MTMSGVSPRTVLAGDGGALARDVARVGGIGEPSRRAAQPDCSGHYVIVFRPGETGLRRSEVAGLMRWLAACRRRHGLGLLVAGCCSDSTAESRRLRLRQLRDQLAECGVPPASIRWTDGWMLPCWSVPELHLPADVVWLEAGGVTD